MRASAKTVRDRVGRPTHRPRRWHATGSAIRQARLSELSAVWRLGVACFSDDGLSHAVLGHYLTARDSTILVVRRGSALAGFAVLRLARDRGRAIAIIVSIGVDPEHRGNGIGRHLLREAQRWCQQAGAECVQLKVAQDNVVALALYRSHGYRVVGRLPHYYGVGRDGLRMERPAQPAASVMDPLKSGPASAMIPTDR
ncbi:MAG: GNAT family N-acetyltransferase [candidate division NC10 bacterium]|nr:GNAT family N-acetyltransferase [candidate division NC10 bacterium]